MEDAATRSGSSAMRADPACRPCPQLVRSTELRGAVAPRYAQDEARSDAPISGPARGFTRWAELAAATSYKLTRIRRFAKRMVNASMVRAWGSWMSCRRPDGRCGSSLGGSSTMT